MRRPAAPGRPVVVKVGSSSLAPTGTGLDPALRRVVEGVAAHGGAVTHRPGDVRSGGRSGRLAGRPGPTIRATLKWRRRSGSRHGALHRRVRSARGGWPDRCCWPVRCSPTGNQYLHAKRTLERMVGSDVVPVVNENDAVSLDEPRFGDNDRLAALVAHLVGATLLVMLTDTSGLLSADPRLTGKHG